MLSTLQGEVANNCDSKVSGLVVLCKESGHIITAQALDVIQIANNWTLVVVSKGFSLHESTSYVE